MPADAARERADVPMSGSTLTPWRRPEPPTAEELAGLFRRQGLSARWWSNAPGERYGSHAHPYHKVLYCARGSIRFVVGDPAAGDTFDLSPGDRLDLPPGTPHSAVVGPGGVTCLEAATATIPP